MSHHFTSVCRGLLVIAGLVCVAEVTKGIEAEAPPPAEPANSQPVDASESQPPDDYDANALYRDIELAKSTIERATKQLEEHPKSVEWRVYRGIAHSATGDFFSALMDFEDAMAVDPTSPEPHRALGYVYRMYHRPDKALACYNKAIELGSKSIGVFMGRAGIYYYQGDYDAARADFDEAIRLHPEHAMAWLGRAMLPNRDWDEAKSDYDKAIELSEHAPYVYAYRAQAHFDRGEYDEFCADILTAMKNNPGDVGVDYDPLAEQELSDEDLKFGKEQLRNMLRDRPEMAEWVEEGDELWNWTLRRFAGSAGVRVSWDPSSAGPTGGVSGEHSGGSGSWIRVEGVKEAPPESRADGLWCAAVFELHNCAYRAGWNEILQQVRDGLLNREMYQLKSHEWEELTSHRTRAFYVKFLMPFLTKRGAVEPSTPSQWYCAPADFITNRNDLIDVWKRGSLWSTYGEQFDLQQAYQRFHEKDYPGCLALLESVLQDPSNNSPEEVHLARVLRAGSLAYQGDVKTAVEEFRKLAQQATTPEDQAYAYRSRAEWLYREGRNAEALEDVNAAVAALPNDFESHVLKADVLEVMGDRDTALIELGKAISLADDDNRPILLRYRAHLHLLSGQLASARQDIDAATETGKSEAPSHWLRGWVNELEHQYVDANTDYDRAITMDSSVPQYVESKIQLLLNPRAEGAYDPQAARQLAQKLCEQTQWRYAEYMQLLARSHAACGEYEESIETERKAMARRDRWERLENLKRIRDYKQTVEEKVAETATETP